MITGSILLVFLGSFVLYNTSKKIKICSNMFLERWIQRHAKYSKSMALLLYIAALWILIHHFGLTSGILFWIIAVMMVVSILIMTIPFRKVTYIHLLAILLIVLVFEYTL